MRSHAPFGPTDLAELDERLLSQAYEVVTMSSLSGAWGARDLDRIGMRHDVDNEIESSVHLARWESERSYRSTYFILHTAPYWADKRKLRYAVDAIASYGHEIGFHIDALGAALEHGGDPAEILKRDLDELRSFGHPVTGVVAHGNRVCHLVAGGFVNDEMFTESARESYGDPDRALEWNGRSVKINPVSRSEFGFEYDPNWESRGLELSDSGGRWHSPFDEVVADFTAETRGPLHVLLHPCWWKEALA